MDSSTIFIPISASTFVTSATIPILSAPITVIITLSIDEGEPMHSSTAGKEPAVGAAGHLRDVTAEALSLDSGDSS